MTNAFTADQLHGEISLLELNDATGGITKGEVAAIALAVASPMGAAVAVGAAATTYAAWVAGWTAFY